MAVTSLWRIKGQVGGVVMYVLNPDKTTEVIKQNTDDQTPEGALSGVIDYVERDSATNLKQYVYGIGGVSPRTAAADMMAVKTHYHKTGGVVAYHGYQSFSEGEVTPELAHEIGKQLAEELWGDRYQVLVTTHLDHQNHIHNHFVINTVSYVDGIKYHRTKQDYVRMQEVSDRLCREHGLSVIEQPQGKKMNHGEWADEKNGELTVRGALRQAIDVAVRGSVNMEQFRDAMDQMGYVIDMSGKYPKVKHIGAPRFMRFRSLGEGYDYEDIYGRILQNDYPEYPIIPEQESSQQIFDGETESVKDMNHVTTYRCFIRAIEITMTRPEANRHMYFLMQNEHRQFESYKVQFRIAAENKLETDVDLLNFKVKVMEKQAGLTEARKALRNALKRAERSGNAKEINEIKFEIESVTRKLKDCRDELKAVDEIAVRSGIMKEKLQLIADEKFRGKEVQKDEHIRRSGRSGPSDDA